MYVSIATRPDPIWHICADLTPKLTLCGWSVGRVQTVSALPSGRSRVCAACAERRRLQAGS